MKITREYLKQVVLEESAKLKIKEGGYRKNKLPSYLKRAQEEEDKQQFGKAIPDEHKEAGSIGTHSRYGREKADLAAGNPKKETVSENKITKGTLKQIIKEEYTKMVDEAHGEHHELPSDFSLSEDTVKEVFTGAFPHLSKGGEVSVVGIKKMESRGEYRSASLQWASYTPFEVAVLSGKQHWVFSIDVTELNSVPEELKKYYTGGFVKRSGMAIKDGFLYAPNYTSLSAVSAERAKELTT